MHRFFRKGRAGTHQLSRRGFLKLGLAAAATVITPLPAAAAINRQPKATRELTLFNPHTQERLKVCYYRGGQYAPECLEQLNHIMRDYRTGDVKHIDTGLFDLLYEISTHIPTHSPFHVISGYRSPATNARLRRHSKGVASKSLHLQGKAVDIRVPDLSARDLREIAVRIKGGGVGYYPKSGFVHVDVGQVRYW